MPALDHGLQMLRGGGQIQRLVRVKLRGDGGEYASPVDFHFVVDLLLIINCG